MAENTIDTLKIEVKANTATATNALKKLQSALKPFQDFADKFEKLNLVFDIDVDKLNAAKKSLSQFTNAYNKLKTALNGASAVKISVDNEGLDSYVKSLKNTYKNTLKDLDDFSGKIKDDFSDIVAEGKTMAELIDKATKPKETKVISEDFGLPRSVPFDWEAYATETKRVNEEIDRLIAREDAIKAFGGKEYAAYIKEYNARLKEAVTIEKDATKAAKQLEDSLQPLSTAIVSINSQLPTLKKNISYTSNGIGTLAKSFDNLINITAPFIVKIKMLREQMNQRFVNSIRKIGDLLKDTFSEKIGSKILRLSNSFGKLASSFEKVIRYRIVSEILNQITDGFKEGTDNLYQYSKALNGQFAESMDSAITSLQYFRNSIGAAAAPLINILAQAFEIVIDKIVEGINWLNQFIAILTGASSWTKAIRQQKEYAEAAEDVSKANKRSLASFDQLNVIGNKNGGSASNMPDYSGMFEEVQIEENKLPDFIGQIKEAFEKGDYYDIGKILAEKINESIQNLNVSELAAKLAQKINDLISLAKGFLTTLDFRDIGTTIAEGLNNLFANINWEELGSVFAAYFAGLINLAIGFIKEFDWSEAIADLADFIKGFFAGLGESFEIPGLKEIGESIAGVINDIKDKLTPAAEWISDTLVPLLKETLSEALSAIAAVINNVLKPAFDWLWQNVIQPVSVWVAENIIVPAIEDINNTLSKLADWLNGKITFGEFIKSISPIAAISLGVATAILAVSTAISTVHTVMTGIQTAVNVFKTALGLLTSPAGIAVAVIGGIITAGVLLYQNWDTIKEAATKFGQKIVDVFNWIKEQIRAPINGIIGFFEIMVNGVVEGLNWMIRKLNSLSFDVPEWVPIIGGETFGFNIKELSTVTLPRLANGGFVSAGQLFIAREAGPEMVGSIGGKNAVANNGQIITGIQYGVASAMNSVLNGRTNSAANTEEQNRILREQNKLLQKIVDKELAISPSVALGRVVKKSQKMAENVAGV